VRLMTSVSGETVDFCHARSGRIVSHPLLRAVCHARFLAMPPSAALPSPGRDFFRRPNLRSGRVASGPSSMLQHPMKLGFLGVPENAGWCKAHLLAFRSSCIERYLEKLLLDLTRGPSLSFNAEASSRRRNFDLLLPRLHHLDRAPVVIVRNGIQLRSGSPSCSSDGTVGSWLSLSFGR